MGVSHKNGVYGTHHVRKIHIGFKPPLDPVNCKGGAYARGRRHVTARASRIDNVLLRLGRRVTTGDQAVFFSFSLRHDV